MTNNSGVKSRDGSEFWSNLPVASSCVGSLRKILFMKSQNRQDLLFGCAVHLRIALLFFSELAFLKKFSSGPIWKIIF